MLQGGYLKERYRIVVEFSNDRNGFKSLLYLENIRSLSVSMEKNVISNNEKSYGP